MLVGDDVWRGVEDERGVSEGAGGLPHPPCAPWLVSITSVLLTVLLFDTCNQRIKVSQKVKTTYLEGGRDQEKDIKTACPEQQFQNFCHPDWAAPNLYSNYICKPIVSKRSIYTSIMSKDDLHCKIVCINSLMLISFKSKICQSMHSLMNRCLIGDK